MSGDGDARSARYRTRLVTRLEELEERLRQLESSLDKPGSKDDEERATEREGDEVSEDLGNAGLNEIRMIRAALDRVENGSFGICAKCGEDISDARLDVVPHTPLCRDCA